MKLTAHLFPSFMLLLAVSACDPEIAKPFKNPDAPRPPPPPAAPPPDLLKPSTVTKLEFTENDFVENDKSRDPFRSFAGSMLDSAKKPVRNQRDVTLPDYSIDELKLVAIVMSSDYPRAMVVDPTGKGWVLKKGEYVGRPDLVHLGGSSGSDYQLNWRVERVRAEDIVFVREDPAQPGIPPATKIVPLHPEADPKAFTSTARPR
jgi:type IV pilus assembly protein PilP